MLILLLLHRLSKDIDLFLTYLFDIYSQMTYPQQQNRSFPDTIAVCLDEDKSVVSKKFLILV